MQPDATGNERNVDEAKEEGVIGRVDDTEYDAGSEARHEQDVQRERVSE